MKKILTKVLVFVAVVTCFTFVAFITDHTTAAAASSNFTIMLNPGHGPSSTGSGAIVGSIKESVLNEKLTDTVYQKLKSYGYRVFITNRMTLFPGDPGILNNPPINRGSQYSFQYELLPATNTPGLVAGSPFSGMPDLAISIHHNSSDADSSANGYEIWYDSAMPQTFPDSTAAYGKTQDTVNKEYDFANMLNSKMSSNFYMASRGVRNLSSSGSVNSLVTYSKVPTVLIEAGFMTNPTDFNNIQQQANMNTMADRISQAVLQYENKYGSGDAAPPTFSGFLPSNGSNVEGDTFRLTANGVSDPSGISGVCFAVYYQSDGSSTFQLFQANSVGNGTYALDLNKSAFGNRYGAYCADAYGMDNRGNWGYMGSTTFNLQANQPPTITGILPNSGTSLTADKFTVTATGASDTSGVAGIYFAVYREADGPSTCQLFAANNAGNGTWTADISNASFGNKYGKYNIDVYGLDNKGNWGYLQKSTDVTLIGDTQPPTVVGVSPNSGTSLTADKFTVTASGASDPSGVTGIWFAVYREADGPSTCQLFAANNAGNGTWTADISNASFGNKYGKYNIDVYGLDNKGNWGYLQKSTDVTLIGDTQPPTVVGVSPNSGTGLTADKFTVTASGVSDPSGVTGIWFAVYREADGPSTCQLFAANNAGNGTWTADISNASFGNKYGKYNIDVYGLDNKGNWGYLQKSTDVTLIGDTQPPTVVGVSPNSGTSLTADKFTVTATGASDTSGVAGIYFAVYREADGPSTCQLFAANNAGNGTWTADISNASFGNKYGKYNIDVYGLDNKGNWGYLQKSTDVTLIGDTQPPTVVGVSPNSGTSLTADKFTVTASGVSDPSGVTGIWFAVYREADGPSTCQLFAANNAGNGTWTADISNASFGNKYGKYNIDVYGLDNKGNWGYLQKSTDVMLNADTQPPTITGLSPSSGTSIQADKFTVTASGASDPSGVTGIWFAVYREADGPSTCQLFAANNAGNGTWTADISNASFGNKYGKYNIDVYGLDNKGNWGYLQKSTDVMLNADTQPPTITGLSPSSGTSIQADKFTVTASGASDSSGVTGIYFAVYRDENGPGTSQLFNAKNTGNGTWTIEINNAPFGNQYGKYIIDVYGLDTKGNWGYLQKSTDITLSPDTTPPTAQAITPAQGTAFQNGKFTIGATGVTDPSGVAGVWFAYYYQTDGPGNPILEQARRADENNWTLDIDITQKGNRSGNYCVDAYGQDLKGNWGYMGSTVVNVAGWMDTNIMGTSQATINQMVNYYNSYISSHGWSFPSYYSTAPALDSALPNATWLIPVSQVTEVTHLAQLYYSLAPLEGVRADVAWAQMLHETGYLQFGNLVNINQLNFSGLGATGPGYPGASFSNIEDGIIAQIQHLKAYASTASCNITNNGPIDPRFNFVSPRGCAPSVQSLSTKWATGSDYGNNILLILNGILTAAQ